jgi:hypothetical protein
MRGNTPPGTCAPEFSGFDEDTMDVIIGSLFDLLMPVRAGATDDESASFWVLWMDCPPNLSRIDEASCSNELSPAEVPPPAGR